MVLCMSVMIVIGPTPPGPRERFNTGRGAMRDPDEPVYEDTDFARGAIFHWIGAQGRLTFVLTLPLDEVLKPEGVAWELHVGKTGAAPARREGPTWGARVAEDGR